MYQTKTIVLDSSDRDTTKHPLATSFSIDLQDPLYNVKAASLVSTTFPQTHNISSSRGTSSFVLTYQGVSKTITVSDRYVTSYNTSLRTALNTAISTAFPGVSVVATNSVFSLTDSGVNGTFSVDTTGVRSSEWDLSFFLGFSHDTVTQGVGTLVTTPFSGSWHPQYLCIKIDELDSHLTTTQNISCFSKITPYSFQYSVDYMVSKTEENAVYQYTPPLRKIDKLTVSLRDQYGALVTFNSSPFEWYVAIEFMYSNAKCV